MASITIAQFRTRQRSFADANIYDDPYIQQFIDDTLCEMSEPAWDCFFNRGQIFLVAHYIALDELMNGSKAGTTNVGSAGGLDALNTIASETEGDTSVSYGGSSLSAGFAGKGGDDLLAMTLYGQQFIELRNKAIIGVANSGQC